MYLESGGGNFCCFPLFFILFVVAIWFFLAGTRIVKPGEKAVIKRMGVYKKDAEPGFHWVIPLADKIVKEESPEELYKKYEKSNSRSFKDAQKFHEVEQFKTKQYDNTYCKDCKSKLKKSGIFGYVKCDFCGSWNNTRKKEKEYY